MVSNFKNHLETNNDIVSKNFNSTNYLLIKEQMRKYPNILFEDEYGTHMLTGFYICALKKISELKMVGLDYILIDAFFIHDVELYTIIDKFIMAMNADLNESFLDDIFLQIKNGAEHPVSEGFFGEIADRLHMIKENNDE